MNALGAGLMVLLVAVVVALVAVPYWRAGVSEPAGGASNGMPVRDQIEAALRREYCLACGMKLEAPDQTVCPHCGAGIGGEDA